MSRERPKAQHITERLEIVSTKTRLLWKNFGGHDSNSFYVGDFSHGRQIMHSSSIFLFIPGKFHNCFNRKQQSFISDSRWLWVEIHNRRENKILTVVLSSFFRQLLIIILFSKIFKTSFNENNSELDLNRFLKMSWNSGNSKLFSPVYSNSDLLFWRNRLQHFLKWIQHKQKTIACWPSIQRTLKIW